MSESNQILDIQAALTRSKLSAARKYQLLAVGRPGLGALLGYELTQLVAGWPGAAGFLMRRWIFRRALGRAGRDATFGRHVTLRHPHKIELGARVVVDDLCLLDAKGESNAGIRIGDGVVIGRQTALHCKNGDIVIGDEVNIGYNCEVASSGRVEIGPQVLIAAYTYLVGGGHRFDRTDVPVMEQGRAARGIRIGAGAWIGAHVTVLDGVTIGRDAVVGAGSVVTQDVPDNTIVVGVPARPLRERGAAPAG